jgi:hypothetical protein
MYSSAEGIPTAILIRARPVVQVHPGHHKSVLMRSFRILPRVLLIFCTDKDAGSAYLTTHRQNTIDRLSLEPRKNDGARISIAGDSFTRALIGPSSIHRGKGSGKYGRVAFITTDGRHSIAAEGGPQPAKLVKIELSAESETTNQPTPATGVEIGTSPAGQLLAGRCDSLPVAVIQWHAVSVSNPRLANNRGPE